MIYLQHYGILATNPGFQLVSN